MINWAILLTNCWIWAALSRHHFLIYLSLSSRLNFIKFNYGTLLNIRIITIISLRQSIMHNSIVGQGRSGLVQDLCLPINKLFKSCPRSCQDQDLTKLCPRYAYKTKHVLRYSQNGPQTCLRYADNILQRFTENILKIFFRNVQDLSQIWPRYYLNISKICPEYVQYMLIAHCPGYVKCMLKICLKHEDILAFQRGDLGWQGFNQHFSATGHLS